MAREFTFGASPERLRRLLFEGLEEPDDQEDATHSQPNDPTKSGDEWIENYRLINILGEGGMGIVYLAEQRQPIRRQVALKVIKPGMDSKAVIARFEAERQALALLDHPNIAHVHDAGTTENGRPYFVMEYVKGIPITEHCDRYKLTIKERLKLFLKICEAIQHAHQKGIIHRDLKPSNIQIAIQDQQSIPKIIDFGVAKAISQSLTERTLVTEQGQFIGTPEYMSPEQAEMTGQDIDTRSDIYSLGVLLYELLTGILPFDPKTLREGGIDYIRRIIREEEPKTPSTRLSTISGEDSIKLAQLRRTDVRALGRQLHGDLDWITLKAMEKDRTRRYQTAHALRDDIQRYLNHEPVLAGPPSSLYKMRKFILRNKSLVASSVTIVGILLLATIVSVSQMVSANKARWEETRQRERAEVEELKARQEAYASDMNLAAQALSQNNLGRARILLNRHRPSTSEINTASSIDLRGWEWRYLWKQSKSDEIGSFCKISSQINSLSLSPNGKWLAIGGQDGDGVSIWDLRTGEQITLLHPEERFVRVAFSPQESLLAFSGVPNLSSTSYPQPNFDYSCIRLWDGTSRQIMKKELPLEGSCVGLQFTQDGQWLVSASTDLSFAIRPEKCKITVWTMPEGKKLTSYSVLQTGNSTCTPFVTERDKRFAVHAMNRQIRVLDLSSGQERWSAKAAEEQVSALALSQDGNLLASSGQYSESTIRLWDVASGQEIGCLVEGHRTWIGDLLFWPDEKTLASASADQMICLWDVSDPRNGKLIRTLREHTAEVWRIALLPDNKTLISGAKDGSVFLWDTEKDQRDAGYITLTNIAAWCFAKNGKEVVTLDREGNVARYRGSSFEEKVPLLELKTDFTYYLTCFSPDNRFLATGSNEGVIKIWDLQQGSLRRSLTCPPATEPVAFLNKGNKLVTVSRSADSHDIWDLSTGQRIISWPGTARLDWAAPAFTPDESMALTVGEFKGTCILRDMHSGRVTYPELNIRNTSSVAFSPDAKYFATGSFLGLVKLWETSTFHEVATLGGFIQSADSVAFSPDGKRLAAGGSGGESVRIWDIASHDELLILRAQGSLYYRTAFSPDGNTLGSMNDPDGRLNLWQAPSWDEIDRFEDSLAQKKVIHY